jgi:hypothetical protein
MADIVTGRSGRILTSVEPSGEEEHHDINMYITMADDLMRRQAMTSESCCGSSGSPSVQATISRTSSRTLRGRVKSSGSIDQGPDQFRETDRREPSTALRSAAERRCWLTATSCTRRARGSSAIRQPGARPEFGSSYPSRCVRYAGLPDLIPWLSHRCVARSGHRHTVNLRSEAAGDGEVGTARKLAEKPLWRSRRASGS